MKGKEIINYAVRAEIPDIEQLRETIIQKAAEKGTPKSGTVIWKRLVPIAACLAVTLTAMVVFQHYKNNNIVPPEIIPSEISNPSTGFEMRGLPVENFSLANIENGGIAMDRMLFMNFGSLFEWGTDCFAVVKVSGTKTIKEEQQISDVKVIQSIYGECDSEAIQITQHIYKNHFCLGTTNLLREGGVYLLPLEQFEGKWYITGDMDFLFEADDAGKVWSHSGFEDFNRFDGKSTEALIEELQNMISDSDFMLVNSPFRGTLRHWTLADITISDKSDKKADENGFYFNYAFNVHEILSEPNYDSSAPIGKTGSIKVYADESDTTIKLLPGNRYLIYLARYESDIYVSTYMISTVGDDGTITAVLAPEINCDIGTSVFTPYNGYKLSDIRDLILRINSLCEAQ